MRNDRRKVLQGLAGGATLAAAGWMGATPARAQGGVPANALRLIVPFAPGSGADSSTRFIAERLGKLHSVPAVVENRPGADNLIGVQALLDAPPDGRTLMLISHTAMVINPVIRKDLPYVPLRDIRPLIGTVGAPPLLVTGATSRHASLAEWVSTARRSPKSVSVGNYGQFYRAMGLMIEEAAGVSFNHVSYKGAAQEVSDLASNTVDLAFIDAAAVLPLIRSGRLRALAATGRSRHAELPGVPTLDEIGFPGLETFIWVGYGVHAKTPEAKVQALEEALSRVITQSDFAAWASQNGLQVLNWSGKDLAARIVSDGDRLRGLIERAERKD